MASKYLKVKCECGNEQTVFSHTSSEVKCTKCGVVIAHPAGGKAIIHGDIVSELG
jgi:small subunit ribosomal protein S27e